MSLWFAYAQTIHTMTQEKSPHPIASRNAALFIKSHALYSAKETITGKTNRKCRITSYFSVRFASRGGQVLQSHIYSWASMPEVPYTCEHHHHAPLIRRINHFLITHRAARLNDAGGACINHHIQAIAEGEKCVAGYSGTCQ